MCVCLPVRVCTLHMYKSVHYANDLFISQGCIGIVKVGAYKCKGLPCPNPEDAKQSAAAIAISNLPVSWYRVAIPCALVKVVKFICYFFATGC